MAQALRTPLDVALAMKQRRTLSHVALAKKAAALLRSHNALQGKQLNERVHKAWRDAGKVVVLEHVPSGALYEDYSMVFANCNTFKADVKLSAGKFYFELDIKHIQEAALFGRGARTQVGQDK